MSQTLDQAFEILTEGAGRLAVSFTREQLDLLRQYCTQLSAYNEHTNLVSDASPLTVVNEHILDSLALVRFAKECIVNGGKPASLIDIGCGAGLPGVVLAIALPELQVTLLDSVGKKIRFIRSFVESTGLEKRVHPVCGRAEALAHQIQYREKFQLATARAVGPIEVVAEITLPFLAPAGRLLLQKSISQLQETSIQARSCLPKLGGELIEATAFDTTVLVKERALVVVEKKSKTPAKYPRDWPEIKARPVGT
ncbi:MAG TPA: 16S rRNA (guanine(527)-N(7))-methyltransferase RsmG [Planktothrix sp.]